MERDEDAGWANPKVLAIFGVIFLCGIMFGALGMRAFLHTRMPASNVRAMDAARAVQTDQLVAKLNLSPEQKKIVMFELDEYAKYYQNIEEERQDVARHGLSSIRKCLTEDQRRVFDRMFGGKQ